MIFGGDDRRLERARLDEGAEDAVVQRRNDAVCNTVMTNRLPGLGYGQGLRRCHAVAMVSPNPLELDLPPDLTAPRAARLALAALEPSDDAQLIVGELVTN